MVRRHKTHRPRLRTAFGILHINPLSLSRTRRKSRDESDRLATPAPVTSVGVSYGRAAEIRSCLWLVLFTSRNTLDLSCFVDVARRLRRYIARKLIDAPCNVNVTYCDDGFRVSCQLSPDRTASRLSSCVCTRPLRLVIARPPALDITFFPCT